MGGKAEKRDKKAKKSKKSGGPSGSKTSPRFDDPALFAALSEGERADALRILTEDRRLAGMAKVGRYRVIAVEPFAAKPPSPVAGRRIARVVAYDYASDQCVEATIDLDESRVVELVKGRSQPMLAIEEEDAAVQVAVEAAEVKEKLSLGDVPQGAMHYWSWREADMAFARRSAAVLFGQPGAPPSLVVVVDLLDHRVAEVVPGSQW